jgi:hypothetical protein
VRQDFGWDGSGGGVIMEGDQIAQIRLDCRETGNNGQEILLVEFALKQALYFIQLGKD